MRKKVNLLIVDDDIEILSLMKLKLKETGYNIIVESNPIKALETITLNKIDIAIIDKIMPEMDGIEFLRHLKTYDDSIQAIIMTGDGSIESAIEAMKSGAYHYITKPINYKELELLIKQAIEHRNLKEENKKLKEILQTDLIAESYIMKDIITKAKKIASFDTTVLITGESGTGKEVLAKFIHKHSKRAEKPFIAINCGAIPADLLESELFGYKKGAFTGANTDKKGIIEEAEGGTLFLDEIGELPLNLQVKLLRLLQEKEYIPVGDTKPKKVNVRFISATNQKLQVLIKKGKFREDLYYRLNTIHFEIPPLRERKEDIVPLANFFIKKISLKYGIPEKKLSEEAINQILSYKWKGNVRELEGTIERTILMEDKPIIKNIYFGKNVSERYKMDENNTKKSNIFYLEKIEPFHKLKEEFEKEYFKNLLKNTNWNISKAAKLSGKTRAEIYRMIKKYNLQKN